MTEKQYNLLYLSLKNTRFKRFKNRRTRKIIKKKYYDYTIQKQW